MRKAKGMKTKGAVEIQIKKLYYLSIKGNKEQENKAIVGCLFDIPYKSNHVCKSTSV